MTAPLPEGSAQSSLARLLDRQQIIDLIYRYCRAADRLDLELIKTAFWEDGAFDGGPAEGPILEIIPTLFEAVLPEMWLASQHIVSNILIEFEGEQRAYVETYLTAIHVSHGTHASRAALIGEDNARALNFKSNDTIEFTLGGRYIDVFARRDGEWRILRRKIVPEWNRVALYTGISTGGQYELLQHRSSRDREDPVYRRD
ncbi:MULTISPECIES: nuclear transport factor 2 family protein [Sphingobium]|uniref:nuclear transport factor 2 family protein n=1 Tax=Sphingobium TaxID=165695 RepID=UPI00159C24F4|nr:nuclear transport factor 2 family protein [Sphingobium sp. 15-1]